MSIWSQVFFQESFSVVIELLSMFHDYSLLFIVWILVFVSGISFSLVTNGLISDSFIVTMVEVIWTVFPVFVLVLLAVPSLGILYFIEENDPYLTLKVTGHQWYWEYEVSDLGINFDSYIVQLGDSFWLGEYRLLSVDHPVVLPINKNVRVLITASDVLHCWTVPGLGVKADAVPGRLNQVYFNILRSSVLFGQCSEICGANHSFMPINVEGLSVSNFLDWCCSMCVDYY